MKKSEKIIELKQQISTKDKYINNLKTEIDVLKIELKKHTMNKEETKLEIDSLMDEMNNSPNITINYDISGMEEIKEALLELENLNNYLTDEQRIKITNYVREINKTIEDSISELDSYKDELESEEIGYAYDGYAYESKEEE